MTCYSCGLNIDLEKPPARQDICSNCGAYLHCCRNCRFYEPHAHNQCKEPQAEWVSDKKMGNFCDYFEMSLEGAAKLPNTREQDARKKLADLFNKNKEGV